jgi:uncharacterized membrane protein YdjX (TVP38/TMEM64 family)
MTEQTSTGQSAGTPLEAQPPSWRTRLIRLWPVFVLGIGLAAFFLSGLYRYLTFDTLALRYAEVEAWRAANPVFAAFVALALYALAVTLSIPLGWLMTLTVCLVFGWLLGTVIAVMAATIGACLVFLAARYALGDLLRKRAGKFVERFSEGFKRDAASYMLFVRLVPVLPFFIVNVVPALIGVPFVTYAWTTFIGILPGTLMYAFASDLLRDVLAERAEACAANIAPCGEAIDPTRFIKPELFVLIVLIALSALLPVVFRRLRRHKPSSPSA